MAARRRRRALRREGAGPQPHRGGLGDAARGPLSRLPRFLREPPRLAVFVALGLATRAVLLGVDIVDLDEASYVVGARELLRGRLLYTDFADHHPPLTYLYYALALLVPGGGMLAVRLLTTLVTVPLTAYAASAFFDHDRRGLVAGLIYLVYGAAFLGHDMLAVNCELLMLLPLAWAVVLARDGLDVLRPGKMLASGLLVGVGVLFKYQAFFWLPALAAAAAYECRRSRRPWALLQALAALGAGFALPLLATAAAFALRGNLDDFLYWNLTHNVRYAANPIRPKEVLDRFFGNFVPFLLVTAPLWWAWRRSLRAFASRYQAFLVSALVILSLPPAFLGLRFYPHYFIQLYWPLALAAAPYAHELTRRPRGSGARVAVAYSLVLLAAFTAVNAFLYYGNVPVYRERRPVYGDVAARLEADPCFAGATLFVWGYAPSFYYAAGLPVASRFVFPEATLVGYVPGNKASARGQIATRHLILEEHWDWLMGDLERHRATYILDTAPARIHRWQGYPLAAFPRLADYVATKYEWIATVDEVKIYRRLGCAASPAIATRPPA